MIPRIYCHSFTNVTGESIECFIDFAKVVAISKASPREFYSRVFLRNISKPLEVLTPTDENAQSLVDAWRAYVEQESKKL